MNQQFIYLHVQTSKRTGNIAGTLGTNGGCKFLPFLFDEKCFLAIPLPWSNSNAVILIDFTVSCSVVLAYQQFLRLMKWGRSPRSPSWKLKHAETKQLPCNRSPMHADQRTYILHGKKIAVLTACCLQSNTTERAAAYAGTPTTFEAIWPGYALLFFWIWRHYWKVMLNIVLLA